MVKYCTAILLDGTFYEEILVDVKKFQNTHRLCHRLLVKLDPLNEAWLCHYITTTNKHYSAQEMSKQPGNGSSYSSATILLLDAHNHQL